MEERSRRHISRPSTSLSSSSVMVSAQPPIIQGIPVSSIDDTKDVKDSDKPTVEGVPLYANNIPETSRFVVQGYQDVWAAVFFIGFVILAIAWGASNFREINNYAEAAKTATTLAPEVTDTAAPFRAPSVVSVISTVVYCTALATLSSVVLLAILARYPTESIVGCNVGCAILYVIIALFALVNGSVFAGLAGLLMAGLQLLWIYLVRSRIPFAALLLQISCRLVRRYRAMVVVNFTLIVVFLVYLIFFSAMMFPMVRRANDNVTKDSDGGLMLLALFMFFWTAQVVINVMHVTASGLCATWYFCGDSKMPADPTLASLRRATTTSFGSICFGSMLVAIVKVLRTLADANRNNENTFVACIMQCLAALLEQLLEYFNVYAFVHVAIYGCGYIEAAKRTWQLAKQCGFAVYFNDCLVQPTLTLMAIAVSFAFAVITWVLAGLPLAVLAFLVTLGVHIIMLKCVESAVSTLFVCYAECPSAALASSPELAAALQTADRGERAVA